MLGEHGGARLDGLAARRSRATASDRSKRGHRGPTTVARDRTGLRVVDEVVLAGLARARRSSIRADATSRRVSSAGWAGRHRPACTRRRPPLPCGTEAARSPSRIPSTPSRREGRWRCWPRPSARRLPDGRSNRRGCRSAAPATATRLRSAPSRRRSSAATACGRESQTSCCRRSVPRAPGAPAPVRRQGRRTRRR